MKRCERRDCNGKECKMEGREVDWNICDLFWLIQRVTLKLKELQVLYMRKMNSFSVNSFLCVNALDLHLRGMIHGWIYITTFSQSESLMKSWSFFNSKFYRLFPCFSRNLLYFVLIFKESHLLYFVLVFQGILSCTLYYNKIYHLPQIMQILF